VTVRSGAPRSEPTTEGRTESRFNFGSSAEGGTPVDPAVLTTVVPNWQAGDTTRLVRGGHSA
jgi:hypothetical protein